MPNKDPCDATASSARDVPELSAPAALQALLGDLKLDRFLAEFYGRSPVHRQSAGQPGRFKSLIDWPVLERLLNMTGCWDETRLRLVSDGRRLPPEHYCFALNGTDGEPRAWRPQPERVMGALNAGATLVLNGLDGLVPAIGRLAHGLETALNVRVQSNLYLSRRGHRGLPLHYDIHDVLALQISGTKRWRWYAHRAHPGSKVPPERELRAQAGTVEREITLEAGDLLYLPAGVIHEAMAQSDQSLHLTFGLKQITPLDVASLVMQHLSARPDMSAPRYDLHQGAPALAQHIADLAAQCARLGNDPAALASLLARIEANRQPRGRYVLEPDRPVGQGNHPA